MRPGRSYKGGCSANKGKREREPTSSWLRPGRGCGFQKQKMKKIRIVQERTEQAIKVATATAEPPLKAMGDFSSLLVNSDPLSSPGAEVLPP